MKLYEMTELKPCPFCGGKAELYVSSHENSDTSYWHKIKCRNHDCGVELGTALSGWSPDYDKQVEALIQRWNRRVKEDKQDDSDDIIRCPKCDSARVFELRIDSDWGSGIGNYGPVNEDTEYAEKDLQLDSYNRPDIDLYRCLECDYMWEPKE